MPDGLRSAVFVAVALALVAAAPAPQGGATGPQAHTLTDATAFYRDVRTALVNGDVAAVRDIMLADPAGAYRQVLDTIPDPKKKIAQTAYEARRQVLDHMIEETVRRAHQDPRLRGRLISVEVGGTAGLEGPGFSPKHSDLDVQFRGVDAEAARLAQQIAEQVMREMNVPDHIGIHPFAATQDGTRIATSTADLNANQRARLDEAGRQIADAEAYVGDANEFVRRDYYERGAAREIRPDGSLGAEITVEELYEQRGWPPPEITEGGAFGVAVNERNKYMSLATDAKRVGRAAEALALVDPDALTPADRATLELADAIYKAPNRDPTHAIQSLPADHPIVVEWDRRRRQGQTPEEAFAGLMAEQETRARALVDKAVERTLQAKLNDVAKATRMTDAEVVDHWSSRAAEGDPAARQWLDEYHARPAAERSELLKLARESVAEQKRLGLVEAFVTMDPSVRAAIAAHPDYAGDDLVQNARALADVMDGTDHVMAEVLDDLAPKMKGTTEELAKASAEHPYAHLPGGHVLNTADTVVTLLAVGGTLYDIATATHEAYEQGGKAAALEAFATRSGRTARDFGLGVGLMVAAQRYGLAAEGMGILLKGGTSAVLAVLLVKDVVDISRAAANGLWRAVQDPLLRGYLDADSGSSFYSYWSSRPELLQATVYDYALKHQLDPYDTRTILDGMIEQFIKQRGGWGDDSIGMTDRLREALEAQTLLSEMYLSEITILRMTDPKVRAEAEQREKEAEARAIEARKAEAEAALRRAREQRADKQKNEEAAERANDEERRKTAAELVAEARRKAAEREAEEARARADADERARTADAAPPDAPAESRWNALKQQADAEARRQAAEEDAARKRADAEAARRAEEEAARKQAEADALFDQIDITLSVPAGLQPGGQASIGVRLHAPDGLSLAGRHVQIRVTPGHTDEASVRLDGSGRGSTVYTAPPDFIGVARVTVSLDGRKTSSRSFAVGDAAGAVPPPADPAAGAPEAPPAVPPAAPPASSPTPGAATPPAAPAPGDLPANATVTVTLDGGGATFAGTVTISNGRATGRLTLKGTDVQRTDSLTSTISSSLTFDLDGTVADGLIRGAYTLSGDGSLSGVITEDLELKPWEGSKTIATMRVSGGGRFELALGADGSARWANNGTRTVVTTTAAGGQTSETQDDRIGPIGGRWAR